MLSYPQPPLTPFQVTLLAEQTETTASPGGPTSFSSTTHCATAAVQRALEASQSESWVTAASMLHSILDLAGDYHKPQVKFAAYSPEKVMRSVRDIVDGDRSKELLELLQEAVRDYAARCVENIEDMRREQQSSKGTIGRTPLLPKAPSPIDAGDEETPQDDPASTLDAVRTLAIFVTYFERLQHGIAELASVWVYANQWCSLQASREIPRSLVVAATQEASEVFRNAPALFEVALQGYCAVLKAELAADTATLWAPAPAAVIASTMIATASAAASASGAATTTTKVAQLKSPATAADAQRDPSALEMLACPSSVDHLTTPLRRRLLFLFTQLTRDTQQYNARVEPVVVQMVRSHFKVVARRWLEEELSAKTFFELSETALKHADKVYQQFLHSSTIPLMEDAIQATLIGSVGAEVLKRDFTVLMEQEQFNALRLAWRLLSCSAHVRSAPVVATLFRKYLLECGQGIMEELVPGSPKVTPAGVKAAIRDRPFLAVRHVIGLLEQGSRTVEHCFYECEKEFKVALHEALQTILEAYPNAFSEQLAAYQDAIMKEVEMGHVPVSLSAAAVAPAPRSRETSQPRRSAEAEEGEGGDEEVEDGSPVRRPRAESSLPPPPSSSSSSLPAARQLSTAPPTLAEGGAKHPHGVAEEERESALGAAALRHAAPLPAEAKEATPVLRRIAYIYSYHPKKDLFEAAYWRDFARRCLHPHRKVDVSAENAFIVYLRDICGLSFTSKFEGMLTDLASSSQLTSQYRTWCQERQPPSTVLAEEDTIGVVELAAGGVRGDRCDSRRTAAVSAVETHLLILAQSFWPKFAPQSPRLYVPQSLQRITKEVAAFYAGLFPNRHLTWQHPLAHATLRAQLTPQGPVLSLIGTYAQCVLLMRLDVLHDKGVTAISVKALCDEVGLDCTLTEVLWSLQGLCHPRCRLVLCDGAASPTTIASPTTTATAIDVREDEEGAGGADAKVAPAATHRQLSPFDVVRLNLDFTSSKAKVRIPLQTRARAAAAVGVDGSGRSARTADNGGHLVEVAIVSCLKARGTVSHADLVTEVNARLPFAVSVPMLKKSIEKMIERGYMVRGKDATYHFAA
jgi:bacterioferritin (cytochrome b1)